VESAPAAGTGGDDLDILVVEQFPDAQLLRRVVFHDQEALAARPGIFLDLGQCRADAFRRGRLVTKEKRTARQRMLTVFVQG